MTQQKTYLSVVVPAALSISAHLQQSGFKRGWVLDTDILSMAGAADVIETIIKGIITDN